MSIKITDDFIRLPRDNDVMYMNFIFDAIKVSDPDASIVISETDYRVMVIIEPSKKKFKQDIINNVLQANHRLNIKIKFSSSLNRQRRISYVIEK